jgi:hypothetical protein
MSRSLVAWVVALALAPSEAAAFKIETPFTPSCHEDISLEAVTAAGFPDRVQAPAPTEDQRRAMNDLTFTLPRRDPWTLALLFGVRSNDIRDLPPGDVSGLVAVHNDPADQAAHCLRGPADDGPDGDLGALASCRAFILGELEAGGLLGDSLELGAVESVPVFLVFRGRISIDLPRFAYRLGRALHALEDSYSHTFRAAEDGAVTHVLNWIDHIDGEDDVAGNGHPHINALDDCSQDDPRMRRRQDRATAAATSLLAAIGDPSPGRRARAEAAVDAALARVAGCDDANDYCGAEELDEARTYGGCAIAGGSGVLAVAIALLLRRRRLTSRRPARLRRRGARTTALAVVLGAIAFAPSPARADRYLHLDGRGGVTLDEPAAAMMLGLGADRGANTFGFAVEWNPWFSVHAARASPGALDVYLTFAHRWYVRRELSLYSRVELGTSTILFEPVGVDRYSTGLYFGGVILGIRIPVRRTVDLTLDPSHLAMPTPQVVGIPFYYGQWRMTVGIEARL